MNYLEFFLFVEDHLWSLCFFTLATTAFYLFLYKRYYNTIFDPFFLVFLISGISASTVFFLFYNGAIKERYLYQFLVSEIAFIIGFFTFKSIDFHKYLGCVNVLPSKVFSDRFSDILFYLTSFLHIVFQLLTYLVVGIPLFLDSRMATFAGGSGFGVVGRIIEVVSVIGIFLVLYNIFYKSKSGIAKFYNYFYLMMVIFFLTLSGSKTNLLFLVYYLFFVNLFMAKIKGNESKIVLAKTLKYQRILLCISIPLIFLVIYIQLINTGGDVSEKSPLLSLGQRIISFGDIFYMAFPNDVIMSMNSASGFLQLFKDPLGMLRIVPWSSLPLDCGIEVYEYHYPSGVLSGPNARYNYFAILYLGNFGQMIYCFCLGLITSFFRNAFFKLLPNNIVFGVLYALFGINLIYIFQDQAFTVARFFNILFLFPVILLITLIIEYFFHFDIGEKQNS